MAGIASKFILVKRHFGLGTNSTSEHDKPANIYQISSFDFNSMDSVPLLPQVQDCLEIMFVVKNDPQRAFWGSPLFFTDRTLIGALGISTAVRTAVV
jgi:hypothetical protein